MTDNDTPEFDSLPNSDPANEQPFSESTYISPTISRLASGQKPKPSTVCATCPAAVWHTLSKELRCYCRTMHVMVWSNQEKNPLTACDGREMAIEALLAQD